ncbi:hypothetical protein PC119_g16210 [Phytophthora cactorum]|uniref:Uncharacterized protein n=1 Tax=Phytophthora cactorum TaxID=29920 RepID=A0A8T0Z2S5_9STRA|nr:hypothetical protein PC113_g11502 [Phytophthora cactorum]KAG3002768.1 hypothetical protein PC119_g16210 [Phytophthora cactorum]
MAGDVASAYRNACTHSECVFMFAGHIPEDNTIIIDLSAAFGWTGSSETYGILGGAVAFIHWPCTNDAHLRDFYNYHWVDDHVNVAPDTRTNCIDIDCSLRHAMTVVMGPDAPTTINSRPGVTGSMSWVSYSTPLPARLLCQSRRF